MLSKKEKEILLHSLYGGSSVSAYRNRFVTDKNTFDFPICEGLVKKGFMEKQKFALDEMGESFLFRVTAEGKKELEQACFSRPDLKEGKS